MSFQLSYGDSCDVVNAIESVNEELKKEKVPIHFDFDGKEHDGFEVCTLIKESETQESKEEFCRKNCEVFKQVGTETEGPSGVIVACQICNRNPSLIDNLIPRK
jgi:hypothetical protein